MIFEDAQNFAARDALDLGNSKLVTKRHTDLQSNKRRVQNEIPNIMTKHALNQDILYIQIYIHAYTHANMYPFKPEEIRPAASALH